jgi:hypothetical protein
MLAAAMALAAAGSSRADEAVSHIALSDPSRPSTLRIRVLQGAVTVRGADVKDITVKTDSTAAESPPREDGMRVLSASSSYRLSERANVVLLEYGSDGWEGAPADFEVTVPRETSVIVGNSIRGDFRCSGISGDIDVRTIDGDVKADDVSGGVCVETTNGEITVNMRSLKASKPLSLTSMNGKVTIRVPSDAKASVRFRTHHGLILTNFDDKALVTRTEVSRRVPYAKSRSDADSNSSGSGSGPAPVPPASPAAPVGPTGPDTEAAPSAESDSDWRDEVRDSMRDAAQETADAIREAADEVHANLPLIRVEVGGVPNIPPLPPMTGGKVVLGTLNGGGADIQAATLNGDIIFRKVD